MSSGTYAFISYSHKDDDLVSRLRNDLMRLHVRVWIDQDPTNLPYGSPDYQTVLDRAIEGCAVVILVATPNSREATVVAGELALAKTYDRPIIPFWMEGDDWVKSAPLDFTRAQYIDARVPRYPLALHAIHEVLKRCGASEDDGDDDLPLETPPRRDACDIVLGKVGMRQYRFVAIAAEGRYPIAGTSATIGVEDPPKVAPYTEVLGAFVSQLVSEDWKEAPEHTSSRWYALRFMRDVPAGYPLPSYDYCKIVVNEFEHGQYRFEAVTSGEGRNIVSSHSTFGVRFPSDQAPFAGILDAFAQLLLTDGWLPTAHETSMQWYNLEFARQRREGKLRS